MRNQVGEVAKKDRKRLAADLKAIFDALDHAWAKHLSEDVVLRWRKPHPRLAQPLDDSTEDCLACYHFPAMHRNRIRTTHGLERLNQEIKRRTRVVRIFPDPDACLSLVTALGAEPSDDWLPGTTYLDMSWLEPAGDSLSEVNLAFAS